MEYLKFYGNENPICPHCEKEIDINEHELWQLYGYQDDEDIICPLCKRNGLWL